jgi:hypothetical protein
MPDGLLGLYWSARQQSLEECAELCFQTFLTLRAAGFDSFYHRGRSRKDALRQSIDVSLEGIRKLLARGVNRRDDNREVIPELGYRIGLWSGHPDDEAFCLDIHCGCYSQWVGNSLTLELPPEGPYSLEHARQKAEMLFDELVVLWRPDQGILTADDLRWEGQAIASDVAAYKRYR